MTRFPSIPYILISLSQTFVVQIATAACDIGIVGNYCGLESQCNIEDIKSKIRDKQLEIAGIPAWVAGCKTDVQNNSKGQAGAQKAASIVSSCAEQGETQKATAYKEIAEIAKSAKVKPNDRGACDAAKKSISDSVAKSSTSSGMSAMQMMQMGQMGMQMLSQLASLAGNGSGGSGGSGSSITSSSGPTAQNLGGDSAVSTPSAPATPAASSSTGASSAPSPSAPFTADLGAGNANDPNAASPASGVSAADGGAPSLGGKSSSGDFASSGMGSSSSGTATGSATSNPNSLAALNAFNQDDGGAGGGAMLGLKGSSDFQGLDPAGKDGAPGALGALGGASDPNAAAEGGRELASGEGQALAQNTVHDQATSLFELVSVKMREMKKRGSL